MPQYLAPGFTSRRSPALRPFKRSAPRPLGSSDPAGSGPPAAGRSFCLRFLDFQRIYGDWNDLDFADTGDNPNYMALGVKGFFDEGGTPLLCVPDL